MALNIKNAKAEDLARKLAAATGESVTKAVTIAVQERLDRMQRQDAAQSSERAARLRRIAQDASGRWVEPYRNTDHGDLLYDESGLPR